MKLLGGREAKPGAQDMAAIAVTGGRMAMDLTTKAPKMGSFDDLTMHQKTSTAKKKAA